MVQWENENSVSVVKEKKVFGAMELISSMGKREQRECCKRKESFWRHGVKRRDNS